jgi:hypothetical protein
MLLPPGRVHLELQLQVYFTVHSSSGAANGAAAAATSNSSKQQQPMPPAAAIQAAVQQLQSKLFSNLQQLVFVPDHIDPAPGGSNSNSSSTAKQQSQAQQLLLITYNSSSTIGDLSSSSSIGDPCISLKLLQHTSSSSGGSPPPAPMFEYSPSDSRQQQLLTLPLSLDVLCYAPSSSSLSDVHRSLLVPALQQQLQQVGVQLQQQVSSGQALCPVRAMHFKPPVLGFPVTACYAVPVGACAGVVSREQRCLWGNAWGK